MNPVILQTPPQTISLQLSAARAQFYVSPQCQKKRAAKSGSQKVFQPVLLLLARSRNQLKALSISKVQNYCDSYPPSQGNFTANCTVTGSSKLRISTIISHFFRFDFVGAPELTHAKQMRFHNRLCYNSSPWGQTYSLTVAEVMPPSCLEKPSCCPCH